MKKHIHIRKRKTLLGRLNELHRWLKDPERWIKGSYSDAGGYNGLRRGKACKMCLKGGTYGVDDRMYGPTYDAVLDTLRREHMVRYGGIPAYNDNPARVHSDIVGIINRTIEWVKGHGGGRKVLND